MKLIIEDYLANLKERNELDVIIPDLFSQMGFQIITRPQVRTTQSGVDFAAVGKMPNEKKQKLYLFSIKPGDLTRKEWDSNTPQALRPSLNQIFDDYIPNKILSEYKNLPIVICPCLGGKIKEQMLSTVSGITKTYSTKNIEMNIWDGSKIAKYICDYLLNENLFSKDERSIFRKSLSMVEEPETALKYFKRFIEKILDACKKSKTEKEILSRLRQINLSTLIMLSWCKDANNLEAVFIAAEFSLLYVFDIIKNSITRFGDKYSTEFDSIMLNSYLMINEVYNEYSNKISSISDCDLLASFKCRFNSSFDVNLKMFNVLGRLAINGLFQLFFVFNFVKENKDLKNLFDANLNFSLSNLKNLIQNNPCLITPYCDNHVVDISLAAMLLARTNNLSFLRIWFNKMIDAIGYSLKRKFNYPSMFNDYSDLLELDSKNFKNATKSSVLYPTIALFSAIYDFDEIFSKIQSLKNELLPHCDFQIWFFDETSDDNFYTNKDIHGISVTDLDVSSKETFLNQIFSECESIYEFEKFSAIKANMSELIFIGCRHYRFPIPPNFLYYIKQELTSKKHQV